MKRAVSLLLAIYLCLCLTVPAAAETDGKVLVAYFSATGTTKEIADHAADILGADIYEIVPAEPYTDADLAYYTGGRADQEQNDPSARPAISGGVEDMGQYDTVLLAIPSGTARHPGSSAPSWRAMISPARPSCPSARPIPAG